jgi:hypothetical protein
MLNQLLNQMDEYLANRPFKRHWWSRSWRAYMTIHPPLSKEAPLWKRGELRSLRLFDLTPEELGRKIEHYWKIPRWRRWFSSFGMNKKIDVWNYYQRCLAYQAVRPDHLEQASVVMPSAHKSLFNELALCLYQVNAKFETYIEKRNPRWLEAHYSEQIKAYKQRLKETFLTKLRKSLKKMKIEEEQGFILKQQAEQEYQQVEALMLRYYHQRLNNFFSQPLPGNFVPEEATEVIQDEEWEDLEDEVLEENLESDREYVMVVAPDSSQPVSSSSPLPISRNVHPTEINPLREAIDEAIERIKKQRQDLESLVEEDALQKVGDLLQNSFNEIKAMTELYLCHCETELSEIKGRPKDYGVFLKYLDDLQSQLKPLFNGGMLLFHPDHVINSTSSQAMKDLICRYSQCYIEQSRYYLNKFKNYPLRIKELYKHSQAGFQKQSSAEWLDITRRIEKLIKINQEVDKEIEKSNNELNEIRAKLARHDAAMEAMLARNDAAREAKFKALEARFSQFFTPSTQPALESRSATASNEESPESSHNTRFFKP